MLSKKEARKAGTERGKAAASWIWDGNTDTATYAAFLKAPDAYLPQDWLIGEWSGESISELLGDPSGDLERDNEIADEFCNAADIAWERELVRIAKYHTRK